MQLTKEQVDNQIVIIQQEILQKQNQVQQLMGYKQALIEMEEDESKNKEKAVKNK